MKIVIKRVDGGVSIMGLAPTGDAARAIELAPEHTDTIVEIEVRQWAVVHPGEYVSHRVMEDDAIPEDRTFRDAWGDTTEELKIDVDMKKCREIWKDKLRRARAPLLAELDVVYLAADEAQDAAKKARVAARKQVLRDATKMPALTAAATPEELKLVWFAPPDDAPAKG